MNKLVYTTGVFDILHRGHLSILYRASKYGNLTVGIQDDVSAIACKRHPILPQEERVAQIKILPFVHDVFLYHGTDQIHHLKRLKPNYMVQSTDWHDTGDRTEIVKYLNHAGIELVLLPYTQDISTTTIITWILERYKKSPPPCIK